MGPSALAGGAATGIGSWPGTDEHEAARVIVGELPALPHLPELPARGLGADMLGRVTALLVDLPVDASLTGYRLAPRGGHAQRTARAHLARDLDAVEEALERAGLRGAGGAFKVQAAGPVTAAAGLELRTGRRVLTDRGALRDLAESLAEGLREHLALVRRRLGVAPVLQLDEPGLPAALAGTLPGPTRFDPVRALPEPEASVLLAQAVAAADGAPVIVHCCAPGLPWGLLRGLDVAAVSAPVPAGGAEAMTTAGLDAVGGWLDAGRALALGLAGPAEPRREWHAAAAPAVRLVDALGFPRRVLAEQVLVTPECGLAGAGDADARAAIALAARIAAAFAGHPDEL